MIQISKADYEAMISSLGAAYPLEACGLMAGQDGVVQRLYPVENLLASPYAYQMEPQQQLEAMIDLENHGWELTAIYHSHPQGPEEPSPVDVAQAYYPEAAMVIVSLRNRWDPSVRAFCIEDGRITEVPLRVV